MTFGKKKKVYQLSVGKLVSPVPHLGDGRFTVSCFVYLEGEKAGSAKWRDDNNRSRFRLELRLEQIDYKPENESTPLLKHLVPTPIDGLEGLTSVSGLGSKVMEDGGLRFDLDRLCILPSIDKGIFRIHANLSRAQSKLPRIVEYEVLAEADSEPFTRGDMTKHRLPDDREMFSGCGVLR